MTADLMHKLRKIATYLDADPNEADKFTSSVLKFESALASFYKGRTDKGYQDLTNLIKKTTVQKLQVNSFLNGA